MRTQFCGACGNDELTTPTAYVPLGWLNRGFAILLLILVWRWALHHVPLVGRGLHTFAAFVFSVLFDTTPGAVYGGTMRLLGWLVVIYFVMAFVPASVSGPLKKVLTRLLKVTWNLTGRVARLLAEALVWLTRQ